MKKFLPIAIFICAIYLRFSRLGELMYFMIDEDRYSFMMKRLFVDHKLMLAGVTIPGGIYLGPGYFYFSGLLQFLVGFNPVMMGAISSLAGVTSVLGVYFIGKKFFGATAGLIAANIYAFSYFIVITNRIYWTLTWSSLAALTTYWSLYKILAHKKYVYLCPLTAWFILGSQSDASYFSLIILAIIFLWRKSYFVVSLIMLFIFQLPLVGFELRHNLPNTHRIQQILNTSSSSISLPNTAKSLLIFPKTLADVLLTTPPYDTTYRLSPAEAAMASKESSRPLAMTILAAAILVAFLTFRFKPKQQLPARIITTHIWIAAVGTILYSFIFPGYVHTWFLTIFLPAFALIVGWLGQLLVKHGWRYAVILSIILFSAYNFRSLLKTTNPFGFTAKKQAVQYAIDRVRGKKFFLNSLGSQAYGGYRYLFWLYGSEPARSYMDNFYSGWIYSEPVHEPTEVGVVMVNISPFEPESTESMNEINKTRENAVSSQRFGGIEVLIVPSP